MICPNPNCGKIHENVRGKCPFCGSDSYGHVGGKYAIQPRDLAEKYHKYRCAHGILRHQPCSKCERSAEDSEDYRRHILADLKDLLINRGVSRSEAWERAKKLLAVIHKSEAQPSR